MKIRLFSPILLLSLSLYGNAQTQCRVISSSEKGLWVESTTTATTNSTAGVERIIINTTQPQQKIEGWGGCFNEIGWRAMLSLSDKDREEVMSQLFGDNGCAFTYCRMPMGASDYAIDYYSFNDNDGDYGMKKFSIDRDRQYMLPYIKAAMKYQPNLKLWGSPWTPPAWMKTNKQYYQGSLVKDERTQKAYALYFAKYVEAYKKEGITVKAVHVQNEPLHLPMFPSCAWTGKEMADFIGTYLGPEFKQRKLDTEIWFGTLNGTTETDEFSEFVVPALSNPQSAQHITGCGFQWYGDAAVESTLAQYPSTKIMQTETQCGGGENDWNYAFETFSRMHWYMNRNAVAYMQWNMALDQSGSSTWGWKQCSMVTVDTLAHTYKLNPQFYMIKHVSNVVKEGAVRLGCTSGEYYKSLAFRNEDGSVVCVVANQEKFVKTVNVSIDKQNITLQLQPRSFTTIVIPSK